MPKLSILNAACIPANMKPWMALGRCSAVKQGESRGNRLFHKARRKKDEKTNLQFAADMQYAGGQKSSISSYPPYLALA